MCPGSSSGSLAEATIEGVSLVRSTCALTVLLVDDAPDLRALVRAMLEHRRDIEVWEAEDGQAAVEIVNGRRPDLVVMDQMMLGMDGVTTTRTIKAIDPSIEVVAFTAVPGAERDFERAGASAHFLKDRFSEMVAFIIERADVAAASRR